jgi:hypothetical protein
MLSSADGHLASWVGRTLPQIQAAENERKEQKSGKDAKKRWEEMGIVFVNTYVGAASEAADPPPLKPEHILPNGLKMKYPRTPLISLAGLHR